MKHAAIIGTTSWYSGSFARALLAQPDVQLVAAAHLGVDDTTMERQTGMTRQAYAERFGGLRLYGTTDELLVAPSSCAPPGPRPPAWPGPWS